MSNESSIVGVRSNPTRTEMLEQGKKEQMKHILERIQEAMDLGFRSVVFTEIKTDNLYPETRTYLEDNDFTIRTMRSSYVPENGNLELSWSNQ